MIEFETDIKNRNFGLPKSGEPWGLEQIRLYIRYQCRVVEVTPASGWDEPPIVHEEKQETWRDRPPLL